MRLWFLVIGLFGSNYISVKQSESTLKKKDADTRMAELFWVFLL